jgi:hypothetical protein
MGLVELMLSMSIFSIAVNAITHSVPVFQKHYYDSRILREELSQVEHMFKIITRCVKQAGFKNMFEEKITRVKRLSIPFKIYKFFSKQFFRNEHNDSPSSPQIVSANLRSTDALLIRHEPFGHFDCLGRKISPTRTHQGLARMGFFQIRGNKSNPTGVLMCQSLTNKGQIQNDILLAGYETFKWCSKKRIKLPSTLQWNPEETIVPLFHRRIL